MTYDLPFLASNAAVELDLLRKEKVPDFFSGSAKQLGDIIRDRIVPEIKRDPVALNIACQVLKDFSGAEPRTIDELLSEYERVSDRFAKLDTLSREELQQLMKFSLSVSRVYGWYRGSYMKFVA